MFNPRTALWVSLTTLMLPLAATAQDNAPWPNRAVRVVVPYAPGNTGDITFRQIQPLLEAKLGARFLIDNKAGASGNIGAEEVVRSKPDGYTLLLGATNNYVTNQHLIRGMRFDPLRDLAPITMVSNAPSVVVVAETMAASNLKELSAIAAKASPPLAFGSPGIGTPPHLAAELFRQLAGVEMVHVPYKGSPPAVQGLINNETQLYVTAFSSVAAMVKAGRLKALAVAGDSRLAALPNVPTSAEQGMPALRTGNWWGLSAPAGTDAELIRRIAAAVRDTLADTAVRERYQELGLTAVGNSPADFAAQMQREASTWKQVIDKAGLTPN
jgi:tripartite-type tricarboxylate transporter receptor subunit TctC